MCTQGVALRALPWAILFHAFSVKNNGTEPGADRGPRAGSPRGVVDATGSKTQLEGQHPVATAPGSLPRLSFTVGLPPRLPHHVIFALHDQLGPNP
jgi:hypothetical protein